MSRFLLALVALVSARPGRRAGARAANADLEGAIRDAYVDKHQVHHGSITVDGEAVEFLEAGPKDAAKTVLFCHGAAFSMTYQSSFCFRIVAVSEARVWACARLSMKK